MNYSTVYVGMDVHKESFSLCCYTNEKEKGEYPQKVDAHYSKIINLLLSLFKSNSYLLFRKLSKIDNM